MINETEKMTMMATRKEITGSLSFKSREGVDLMSYDWDSLDHGIDIWFAENGWKISSDSVYTSDICTFSSTSKETLDGSENGIRGSCTESFEYDKTLRKILKIVKSRNAVVSGRIYISSPAKIISIIITNNKVENRMFDLSH